MEYNFFSFADTISNDDDLIGVFDVRNCFTESDMRKYVELYIPVQSMQCNTDMSLLLY